VVDGFLSSDRDRLLLLLEASLSLDRDRLLLVGEGERECLLLKSEREEGERMRVLGRGGEGGEEGRLGESEPSDDGERYLVFSVATVLDSL
jgi:hypothetical protein